MQALSRRRDSASCVHAGRSAWRVYRIDALKRDKGSEEAVSGMVGARVSSGGKKKRSAANGSY